MKQMCVLCKRSRVAGVRLSNKEKPEKITDIRSLIGSINQFIRFISNLAATTEPF